MKINLSAVLVFYIVLLYSPFSLAADINVTTAITTTQTFDSNNQNINITGSGDIAKTTSPSNIVGSSRTGIGVLIEAATGKGLSNTASDASAISISNSSVNSITVNSGLVTAANGSYGATINLSGLSGSAAISVAADGNISNTSSSGSSAISYNSNNADAELNITNLGHITATNAADSAAISFSGLDDDSILNITNQGGTISGGTLGTAINADLATVTIINSASGETGATITGDIDANDSVISITNDGLSTITGDINLGSRETSFVSNSGTITGNVTFGDYTQYLALESNASFTGAIIGEGSVILRSHSNLTLNSGTLEAAINGGYVGSDIGNLHIGEDQTVIANEDISIFVAISDLVLEEGSTLDLATNNKTSFFTNGVMKEGSTLEIGSATLQGNIYSNTTEGLGTVNFHDDYTLGGTIGLGGFALNTINVASGKNITNASNYDIAATTITINEGASISTTGGGRFDGAATLGSGSSLTFGAGTIANGSINGSADSNGTLNIEDGIVLIYSKVGNSHDLSEVNVNSGSQGRFLKDIAANNVNFSGQLDLEKTGGNAISGNLTGSGSGILRLYDNENTVSGNLTIASGNTLMIGIANDTTAGSIIAAGTASVNANTTLRLSLSSGATRKGATYTIVSGGNGSTIEKIATSNINVNDSGRNSFSGLRFTTLVSGNDLILSVDSAQAAGSNNNQRNLYNHITGFDNASGNLLTVKNLIESEENAGTVSKVLESVDAQVDNSSNRVSFNNSSESLQIASNRLETLRGISSGDEVIKKSTWAQTFGSKIHQGNNSITQGYQASTYGFAFGFDHEVLEDAISGISLSYANSNINSFDKLKRTMIDTYQINLYGSKNFENYFLNAMTGIAFNTYNSRRNIQTVSALANAKYSGQTYIAKVEAGSNYKIVNDFILTPTFAITAARNSVDDYEEGGAGTLNLSVKNRDTSFFETRIGGKISKNLQISKTEKIRPHVALSYGYDFAGSKQRTSSRFVGQSAGFTSSAAGMPQGSLRISSGLQVFYTDSFSLDLGYDFDYRINYNAHSGSLKAKYEF